jgi:hypothetical protein
MDADTPASAPNLIARARAHGQRAHGCLGGGLGEHPASQGAAGNDERGEFIRRYQMTHLAISVIE